MAEFDNLVKAFDINDQLDEIASAEPPAYLKRCFAEGISSQALTWRRIQQLAVCSMVLDAIVNDRDYAFFERELISDWRVHYTAACRKLKDLSREALTRVLDKDKPESADTRGEIELLIKRLAGV